MKDTWSDMQEAWPASPFKQFEPRVCSLSALYQYIHHCLRKLKKC